MHVFENLKGQKLMHFSKLKHKNSRFWPKLNSYIDFNQLMELNQLYYVVKTRISDNESIGKRPTGATSTVNKIVSLDKKNPSSYF